MSFQAVFVSSLSCLSERYEDPRLSVSRKSIETLFDAISMRSKGFPSKVWKEIFTDILTPMFVGMAKHLAERAKSDQNVVYFLKDTSQIALNSLVELVF